MFSLILLSLVIQAALCAKLLSSPSIHTYLSLPLSISVFIWYFIPGLLYLFFPYDALCSRGLCFSQHETLFVTTYMIESCSLAIILALVWKFPGLPHLATLPPRTLRIGTFSFTGIIFVLYGAYIISRIFSGDFEYWQLNSASLYDERSGDAFRYIIGRFLLAATFYITIQSDHHHPRFYIGFVLICLEAGLNVYAGGRISLVLPLVVLLLIYTKRLDLRTVAVVAFSAAIVVFLILPISYAVQQTRGADSTVLFAKEYQTFDPMDLAGVLFMKFNSFSSGAELIVSGGGLGYARIEPYLGSLLVFMPRALFPNRPVAGSSDGTIYGHPSRVVPAVAGIHSDALNVGVSPAHIALWHFGYFGLIIFVLSGWMYLNIINKLLKNGTLLYGTCAVYLLNIPSFLILNSPDNLVKQSIIIGAIILIFAMIREILKRARILRGAV